MAKITLRKTRETRVRGGHPWIYASEIERVEGEFENGDIVDVFHIDTVESQVLELELSLSIQAQLFVAHVGLVDGEGNSALFVSNVSVADLADVPVIAILAIAGGQSGICLLCGQGVTVSGDLCKGQFATIANFPTDFGAGRSDIVGSILIDVAQSGQISGVIVITALAVPEGLTGVQTVSSITEA